MDMKLRKNRIDIINMYIDDKVYIIIDNNHIE
jgi:hypothetical protein